MSRQRGFTLIELMITLVVLIILTTIAAPSFSEWLARSRITSRANELVGDLSLARSESATRGARVTVCARSTNTACDAGGDWNNGWLVFIDLDGDGSIDAGETVLKVGEAMSGNTRVVASGFGSTKYVRFRSYGGLDPATAGSFSFCSDTIVPNGVAVSVAAIGRAKAAKVTDCAATEG